MYMHTYKLTNTHRYENIKYTYTGEHIKHININNFHTYLKRNILKNKSEIN